jgi:hypothetical protein
MNWLRTLLHTWSTSLTRKEFNSQPISTAKYSAAGTKLKLQTRRYIAVLESWALVVASRTSATLLNCTWSGDFSSFVLLLMVAASQAAALSSMLCCFGPSWACSAHVLLPRSPLPLPLPTQYPPYRFHYPIFLGGMPRLLTDLGTTMRQKRVWVFFIHYLLMSNRDVHDQL